MIMRFIGIFLLDPHLMATIQQRKMQVMQLEWEIVQSAERKGNSA